MNRECEMFRAQFMRHGGWEGHPDQCPECAEFAHRWTAVTSSMADGEFVAPPPGFAAAVTARLPRQQDPLITFALRTVPVTGVLVIALAAWLFTQGAFAGVAYDDPVEESMAWVFDGVENSWALEGVEDE